MIYDSEPENFNPKFEVVSCFVEYDKKILLLLRQDHKPEGNTYGVPAGKVNEGEKPLETIIREIREETGLEIDSSQISYFRKVYVRYPAYDFEYYIFHSKLEGKRDVQINSNEHKEFRWTSPEDALDLQLIQDLDACIRLFYQI